MNIFKDFITIMPGYYVNPAATAKNTIKKTTDMKKVINDLFKHHRAAQKESQFNKRVQMNIEFNTIKKDSGLFFQDHNGYLLISGPTGTGEFLGKISPIYKEDRAGNVYRAGYKYDNYCK
jgi:hypothetical protein